VFIETRIWISDYGYDQTLHAFDKSAGKLGVDRIDLPSLHQALPSRFDLTQEAYRALETLFADGRVRAIGVSNFMPEHLDALLKQATVVPAVNHRFAAGKSISSLRGHDRPPFGICAARAASNCRHRR
jgi:diketogulonate reductase-like aldo/keto reductase